jgi:hypothetical protein
VIYLRVRYLDGSEGYQEIYNGITQRLTDLSGITIETSPPYSISNPEPEQPSWELTDPAEPTIYTAHQGLFSKQQFMSLFAHNEISAIYTAAKTDVDVEIWLDRLRVQPDPVDLQAPLTIEGVGFLVSKGFITQERLQEILNA